MPDLLFYMTLITGWCLGALSMIALAIYFFLKEEKRKDRRQRTLDSYEDARTGRTVGLNPFN